MLPHKHFLIALPFAIIIVVLFFPELAVLDIVKWCLVAGITSILVDLDVSVLIATNSKLKRFKDYGYINRNYNTFLNTLAKTGLMKIVTITHLILAAIILIFFYFVFQQYIFPAIIGVITHLLTDLPNLRKLF